MNRDFILGAVVGVVGGIIAGILIVALLKQIFNYDSQITEEAVRRLNTMVDDLESRG